MNSPKRKPCGPVAAIFTGGLGATMLTFGATAQVRSSDDAAETLRMSEIVITATRRETTTQETPGSITALSQDFTQKIGAQNLSDVVSAAPGLSLSKNSPTEQIYTIRGVNTNSAVINQQSPTALYFGEVPLSDPYFSLLTPTLQLFDINRVEVLLGPQGTLFGAGALGGAIRMIPNEPNPTRLEATIEQMVATRSHGDLSYGTNIMLNAPLVSEKLAVRLVGSYLYEGGYIDNPGLNQNDYNDVRVASGRAQIAWLPTSSLTFTGTIALERARPDASPYTGFGSDDFVYSSAVLNRRRLDTNIFNLVGEYRGDSFTATSSSSYLRRSPNMQTDLTELVSGITGLPAPATDAITGKTENLVQELRFASSGERRFNWLVGVYLQHYSFDETNTVSQPGAGEVFAPFGFPSDVLLNSRFTGKVDEIATYGEASYDLTEHISATIGLRAFQDWVRVEQVGDAIFDAAPVQNNANYSGVTPKFVISYKPADQFMFYVQAAEGFRSGQGNIGPASDPVTSTPIPRSYGPDRLWNYEVGTKADLLDRQISVTAAVYYIDWSKIQLQQRSPSGFQYTANAGSAWIRGVSLQVIAHPTTNLDLGFSLDYHKSRLKSVAEGVAATVGDRLPASSPFTAYVYGEYNFQINEMISGFFRTDYSYNNMAFSDLNNSTALTYGNVNEVNATFGLNWGQYEVSVFGKNLANSRSRVSAFQFLGVPTQVLQTPRTIGITARVNY